MIRTLELDLLGEAFESFLSYRDQAADDRQEFECFCLTNLVL